MKIILYFCSAEVSLVSLLPRSYNKGQARVVILPYPIYKSRKKSMDILPLEVIAALNIVNFLTS
jgi:hypothetical protein